MFVALTLRKKPAKNHVTVLKMPSSNTIRSMKESEEIEKHLWRIAGASYVENYLAKIEPYCDKSG